MFGADAGVKRRMFALKSGKPAVYGASDEGAWDHDVNGAIAELACAKWAGVYWNGTIGETTLPDVGPWQIRSKIEDGHRLVIRPTDSDNEKYVSVLVTLPTVVLCGWMWGHEGKEAKWLKEYPPKPPMYFIEDHCLRDMQDLATKQPGPKP